MRRNIKSSLQSLLTTDFNDPRVEKTENTSFKRKSFLRHPVIGQERKQERSFHYDEDPTFNYYVCTKSELDNHCKETKMDEECQTQENCSNLKITYDQKQVIQNLPEPQANTYNINVDRVTITDGSLKLDKDKPMVSDPKKRSNTSSYSKTTARKPRTFRKKLAPRYAYRIAYEDKVASYLHEIDIDYYRLRLTLIFLITIWKNGKSSSMQKTVGPLSFYHLIPGPFSLAALLINYFIHTFQNFMSSPNASHDD